MIQEAASNLSPGNIAYAEGTYESIVWRVDNPPSKAEVEAEVARLEEARAAAEYQRLRVLEYPPLTELADAIYWNESGVPARLEEYVAACAAVKAKYPEPVSGRSNDHSPTPPT